MTGTPTTDNQQLLQQLKNGSETAFKALFDQYFKYLVVTINNISGDIHLAQDIAQDVFCDLWNKRSTLNIQSNLKAYLRRAAVNKMLNKFKAKRLDYVEPNEVPEPIAKPATPLQELEATDLQSAINQTIRNLPERCRLIFQLRKQEGLSHQEISEQLEISKKTIENQLAKAMKIMRAAVAPFVRLLVILLGL